MGQLRNAVRGMAPWCADPGQLLRGANEVADRIDGASFVTMAYATFDAAAGDLFYACVGHPPPLLVRRRVERVPDGRAGLSVGLPASGATAQAHLELGDRVLYSDGLIERRGEDLLIGIERLRTVASTVQDWSASDIGERLAAGMPLERPLRDDLCVLTMHYAACPDAADEHLHRGRQGNAADRPLPAAAAGSERGCRDLQDRRG